MSFRVGQGFDVHQFAQGRNLILGGVNVPAERGLLGHSDADVLVHAIMDAIIGAVAGGDIGVWFPDTDPKYSGADSIKLLEQVWANPLLSDWELVNIDSTIIAQKPKLSPFIVEMRENIAKACGCEIDQISVKATTTEKLGFCGREEGIAAQAVVMLSRKQNKNNF